MLMLLYTIKVGLFAGIIMSLVGMAFGMLGFTNLDLTTYVGCFLSGQSKGRAPFIAGTLFHLFASAFFGMMYAWIIFYAATKHQIYIQPTLFYGITLGLIHTVVAGSLLVVIDKINPCVISKKVPRMSFATSAHGAHAVIVYTIIHLVYVTIVVKLLA